MKKSFLSVLAIFTFIFAFFSCSDGLNDYAKKTDSADGKTYLVVGSASMVQRTLKTKIDLDDLSSFVLKRSLASGQEEVLASADSLEELKKEQIEIEVGLWDFTLSAQYTEPDSASTITFSGSTSEEIEAGKVNSISFALEAEDSFGGLSITVEFEIDKSVSRIETFLTKVDTGAEIETKTIDADSFVLETGTDGSGTTSKYAVTYSRNAADENERLEKGYYHLVLDFYADGLTEKLNTLDYYIRVTGGLTTNYKQTVKLNETYSITYNDGDGKLASGETKALKYSSKSESIVLPKMEKEGYVFAGWFEDENFTQPISQIEQGSRGDKNIYAAYINSVTVSANGSANADIVTGQPVDSVDSAVSKIKSYSGSDVDWTILVDGVVPCVMTLDLTTDYANSLTFAGAHDGIHYDEKNEGENYYDALDGGSVFAETQAGATIKGSIFTIYDYCVPITIKNLKITHGNSSRGYGGAFDTNGTVTLDDGTWITDNHTYYDGGAIMNTDNATLTIKAGVRIDNNSASDSGGAIRNAGTLIIEGGEIMDNTSGRAVIQQEGTMIIKGSPIFGEGQNIGLAAYYPFTAYWVTVDGELDSNIPVITIAPGSFTDYNGKVILKMADDSALTEEMLSKFAVTQPTSGTDRYEIDLEGKLAPKKAATSGSVTTDNRVLNISLNTTQMYKNTILRFSVTDAWGNDVTDTVTFDAELLYQGKDVNTLAKEGTAYYTVDGSSGTLTLILDNPLPKEGSYQLYVTASRNLNGSDSPAVSSSQTFDVSFINEIVTPDTQAALYEYFSTDSYPNSYSYYLTDSSKVENAALATSSFEGNTTKTTFDVYGYFYILSDESSDPLLRSNNPIIAQQTEGGVILSEINYELSEGKPCNFTVDMANNKAYAWSGNYTNKTILYRYPNIFTSGSASDYETINLTSNGFIARNVVIYNDIVYVIGYDSASSYTCRILTYDISNLTFTDGEATVTEASSTYDLSAYFEDKMAAQWQITDAYALEGALYFLVYDSSLYDSSYSMSSAWSSAGENIYERGAIVKYLAPLNGEAEINLIGLKSNVAYANTDISQLLFYESSYGLVHTTEDLTSPVVTIIGSEKVTTDSERLCNYYFPNIYGVTSVSEAYFAHPSKFIAVKPKKLVIADDGIAFYSDTDGLSYKNADRVITVDLQDFVIESVQTSSAKFSEKVSGYFRTNYQLRLSNIISDNNGYYDSDKTCYYYDGSAASIVGKNLSEADLTLAFGSSDE